MNPFLAAFRSGFGCQSTLLRVIEDWKHALDKNEYLAAIIMDLSKAFDCLPHDLLLVKLNAYGLSKSSLDLRCSYLLNRKQCVKLNQNLSNMLPKGYIKAQYLDQSYFNKRSVLFCKKTVLCIITLMIILCQNLMKL